MSKPSSGAPGRATATPRRGTVRESEAAADRNAARGKTVSAGKTAAQIGAAPASGQVAAAEPPKRAQRAAARRQAILDAALEEFAAKGFAAARLDDVAVRAGVAKGTIYLHFRDKDALFHELVRSAIVPIVGRLEAMTAQLSARALLDAFAHTFAHDICGTRRGDIVRLVITEGARFPALADVYYREVVSRGLPVLRAVIAQGVARGEIADERLAQFPQLVVAPALVALLWSALFGRHAPLDVEAMLRAHLDLIFGAPGELNGKGPTA